MFDPAIWARVPFHFWSAAFFIYGCMIGSFLNVCIHRMPRGESIVSPPSHCPHCNYSIPWFLNIPLVTWLLLRGKCANCRAPISVRYFLVELFTGIAFLGCWLSFGGQSLFLALVYAILLAGFIAATFIDFEHLIIPDEITLGGVAVGFLCSLAVPALHDRTTAAGALQSSFWGIAVGGGLLYLCVRVGKLFFGRQNIELAPGSRIVFTETGLMLAGKEILYEEVFYRKSDTIRVEARTAELVDRCYKEVSVRLAPDLLKIGEETFNPEEIVYLEVVADKIVLPREAMGLGDVKFMAAIGAFLGWKGVAFSLMASSMIGSVVGLTLILLGRQAWSSRLPYGPYIALAATIWVFAGHDLMKWWQMP